MVAELVEMLQPFLTIAEVMAGVTYLPDGVDGVAGDRRAAQHVAEHGGRLRRVARRTCPAAD